MATFIIADTHFGHENIIRLCNRPFANVGEMDRVMRDSWNAVVRHDDDVIVVGDFAHRMPSDKLRTLFDSLRGRKHLIVGNHDDHNTLALPWSSLPRDVAYMSVDNTRVVMCHYAWRVWPGIRKGALMLHGHNHGRIPGNQQSADIGVDVLGFAPVRLKQITAYMATLPPLVDPEAGGDDLDNDDGGLTP